MQIPEEVLERCVLCWKETAVPAGVPLEQRACYVPGVGQLCPECWRKMREDQEAQ